MAAAVPAIVIEVGVVAVMLAVASLIIVADVAVVAVAQEQQQ